MMFDWIKQHKLQLLRAADRDQKLQTIRNWCISCELRITKKGRYYLKSEGLVSKRHSSSLLALSSYQYFYKDGDILINGIFADVERVVWQMCCVLDIENHE